MSKNLSIILRHSVLICQRNPNPSIQKKKKVRCLSRIDKVVDPFLAWIRTHYVWMFGSRNQIQSPLTSSYSPYIYFFSSQFIYTKIGQSKSISIIWKNDLTNISLKKNILSLDRIRSSDWSLQLFENTYFHGTYIKW